MNLVLLNYNNYFNRIVKTASHISDYLYLRKAEYIFNVNFNPNDGVETEQVINWKEYWTPDYLLEYDPSDDSINSRWFIIEWVRLRNGQYRAKLRRDLLADYYSEIKDSPIFVERATLIDSNNRLIFNPEGFNPNQIKNDEILLKDKSGCPWLVAYLQKGTLGDADSHGTVSSQTPKDVIEIATDIRNWKFYEYREKDFIKSSGLLWVSNTQFTSYYIKQDGSYWYRGGDINAEQIIFKLHGSYINYVPDGLGGLKAKTDIELGFKSDSDFAELFSFNGKIVKDTDGKYYRVQVINSEFKRDQLLQITPESYNELYGIMSNLWVAAGQQAQDAYYVIRTDENCYRVILTAVDELTATWSAVSTTRKTNNPLYDIIFLPYADKVIKVNTSGHSNMKFRITKESAMDIMNAITKDLTSAKVLDLQLLPYCPVQSIINDNGEIILTDEGSLIPVESSGTLKAAAYVAEQSTFTFDIEMSVVIPREKTIEPVSKVMDQTFTLDAWGYGGGTVKPWVDKGIYPVSVDAKVYNYPYMPGDNPIGTCEAFVAGNKVFYSIQNGQWANFDVVVKLSITGEKDEGYKNQFATDLKISNECDKYRLCSPNYNGLFEFSLAKMMVQ